MGKKGKRPPARGSGGRSRPPRRWDSGSGGGTTGYTGGTRHKSSSVEGTPILTLVYGVAAAVVLTVVSLIGYLAHGYEVI